MISYHLLKVLILTAISFVFAFSITPWLENFLYAFKAGKNIRNDGTTPIFSKLHASKQGTPTMAGILVWATTAIMCSAFWILDRIFHLSFFHILNFLTRKETLLPLGAFVGASLIGLIDDFMDMRGLGYKGRGLRFRHKFFLYAFVALVGAYWFYFKLGFDFIQIPFYGNWHLGLWYIPFFALIVTGASFAVNQTDGLDGLAGGTLLMAFFSYGIISYLEGKYELAAFIGVITGGLLAFLWFNVFPAKFFMGDTGSMGMGTVLAIIAFLVGGISVLPVIGLVFVLEALSYFGQIFWRKVFKKKLFLSAPMHHHLEARGWPEAKVTFRLWIVSMVAGLLGVIIHFIGIK
jgi:phospho-N-acetylmuramoyl-pentapeptide-transferase